MSIKPATKPIRQVNDSVYELYRPIGRPSMQVLFFHGLQLGDYEDAHLITWESRDGSHLWPQTWLVDEFPNAHVFSVSYDARVAKGHGNFDLQIIGENLTSDLVGANIGQEAHCPVILVGHCFGGIVIKKLCLLARQRVDLKGASTDNSSKLNKFLGNIKGVFYYATPHRGIPLNIVAYFLHGGPLLPLVKTLSTESVRLNSEFDDLRLGPYKNAWRIAGVGESLPTKWGRYHDVVVPEASARDGERFNVVKADHISISKPENKTSMNFYALTEFLASIALDTKVTLPVHECQGLPDYPVGLEGRATGIREKLQVHQVLGIVGMGGIGKTTLAKEVFNGISQEFEYTCFVDNVKGKKIDDLADWIQSHFCCNGRRVHGGRTEWAYLKDKKMLIIMDDVDTELQLNVLPKLNHFGNGSRVIITTRDQNVLKVYDTHVYEVEFLKDDEAKKLFCEHAFGHQEIPNSLLGMQQLIRDVQTVVRKCNGLPLTLEVIGRHLRDHENDAEFWEGTISRLGEARAITGGGVDRVWTSLQVSYDALVREEKEMFASAATFFFNWPVDRALAAWSTTCGRSGTGWKNLVSRCLVKEVSKRVWVHEHLRDMAKILAPGNMESASDRESARCLVERLNAKEVKAQTEFLKLACPDKVLSGFASDSAALLIPLFGRTEQMTLPFRSLLNVEQLKYMELEGVLLKGSPKKFPRQLSLLRWDAPIDKHAINVFVECLRELHGDRIVKYFNLDFPITCIEKMENLAVLELKNWLTSKAFPKALGKLTNLRLLHLEGMKAVDLLPEDLGQLSRLKHLVLVELYVSKLPESFGCLSSLVELRLVLCGKLVTLPENFGQLKALRKLTIWQEELQSLPSSFGLLESLHELDIRAERLQMLPENLGQLTSLERLDLRVKIVKALPESVGQLCSMSHFNFECDAAETLPDSLGQLASLRKLKIECQNVKELPNSLGQLASLQELEIVCCNVKELPDTWGRLCLLEEFIIEASLARFPKWGVGELCSLKRLKISAGKFEFLPESLGHLSSLQTLRLWSCEKLKSLPDSLGRSSSRQVTIDTQNSNRSSNALREIQLIDCLLLDDSVLTSLGWCTTDYPTGSDRHYVRGSISGEGSRKMRHEGSV